MPAGKSATDTLVVVACLASVAFAGVSYFRPRASAAPGIEMPSVAHLVGKALPPITVLRPDGTKSVYEFVSGANPTLVILFRSTCPACERTAPQWRQIPSENDESVKVLAVNAEGPSTALQWLARHRIVANEVLVPEDLQAMIADWKVSSVPLTVVINRSGRVTWAQLGALDEATVATIRRELQSDPQDP